MPRKRNIEYVHNSGSGSQKPKSPGTSDRESIPQGGMPVHIYLKEPYLSRLMELYPGLPLSKAARQFIIDKMEKGE